MAEPEAMSPLEWATHSRTAHVVDSPLKREGRGRSGPRALCGRYPFRDYDPWFDLSIDEEDVDRALKHYGIVKCVDCIVRLADLREKG